MSILFQGSDTLNHQVPYNATLDRVFTDGTVTEPVTLQQAKDWCKIDTGTVDDTIVSYLITTARQQCEDFTGLSLIPRTVEVVINNGCGGIFLPYGPFKSLTSIKDSNGDDIPTDQYKLSGTQFPQLLYPKWYNMTLVYVAGYGSTEWPLPQEIKTAILEQVFYLYQNRGETALASRDGSVVMTTLSPQARSTLNRIKRV